MKRLFYIILLFLAFVATLAAQTYPIRTITIVTPPYPATLEDFYANGGNKLNVQVLVNDLALSNYPVKFRVKLLGPGVDISSDPNFVPKPFLLNGGETYNLSGSDLTAYFNPDNLIFTGYSKTQYQRTGRLPDGVYRLSFEVLFYNNSKISVASVVPALIWLSQNEPPLLNFPANQEVISAITPQNIMLNWTMRQSPFSTPSFSPEYKFDLWEIWPDEKDPNDIAQSTRPIFTTTVTNTSLIYTVNEPLLFVGRRYAWRVQVTDPDGNARFSNNGYSEVRWFRFGKVCPVPVLKLDTTGISHIAVKWDGDYRENKYQVRYREKNKKDAEWYTSETTNVSLDIKNLKPATGYELQVCGYCDDQLTDYSNIVSAQTTTETNFACGAAPAAPDLSQPKLLEKLNPKDYIKAGDFDVQVSSATGSNGTFTGKGVVLVPYLKYLRVAVTFKNIKVNEDHRLTNGVIYTVYDLNNSLILKTSNPSFLQVDPNKPVENNDLKKVASINIETDTTIRNVTFSNGVVTITDDNGNITHTRATSDDIVAITNKDNPNESQYVADTKTQTVYSAKPETYGTNANTTSAVPQPKSGGTQYNVTFARHNLENYGFDAPSTTTPAENYESVTIDGKPQLIPWKSVEAGKFDRVKAKVTGGSVDSVHFRRESEALVMTAPGTADTAQLMLSGQGDMDEDKVFAWYSEYTKVNDTVNNVNRVLAGQLNMTSYEKKKLTVYLVPVNGSIYPENLPIVEAYLNKIYAPALVEWTVKSVTGFKVSINGTEAQKIDNSSLEDQMNYTADMKAVTDAFQTNTNYNNDSYYLFFLNDGTDQNIKGYMPFNKQFGFIFKYKQGLDPYLRTIAHELGHGPFRLYHTFSDKNKYVQSQGNTNNLMDYVDDSKAPNALNLQKYQWDEIHSWHMGANWLEEADEEKNLVYDGEIAYFRKLINSDLKTFTFITPAGTRIALPIGCKFPVFTHNIDDLSKSNLTIGTLQAFVGSDGKAYNAKYTSDGLVFNGYKDNNDNPYNDTWTEKAPNDAAIMLFVCGEGAILAKFNCTLLDYKDNYPSAVKSESYFSDMSYVNDNGKNFKSVEYDGKIVEGGEITPAEIDIIGNNCITSNMFYLHKIAALRNLYPSFFENFTQNFDSWNHLPDKTVPSYFPYYTPSRDPLKSEWDKKMRDNDKYRTLWKNNEATFYELFINEFKAFAKEGNVRKNQILKDLCGASYEDAVYVILSSSDDEIQKIPVYGKICLLKIFTQGDLFDTNDNDVKIKLEAQALKLFTLTNDPSDRIELLKALIYDTGKTDDEKLLQSLCRDISGFDNPEFTEFILTIYNWMDKSCIEQSSLYGLLLGSNNKSIAFAPAFWRLLLQERYLYEYFDKDGKIVLATSSKSEGLKGIISDPYSCIFIEFKDDYTIANKTYHKGEKLKCPAIFGYLLFNNASKKNLITTAKLVIDASLFAIGVGEITATIELANLSHQTFQLTRAIVDIGLSVSDLGVTTFTDEIEKSENGQNFLKAWNTVQLLYGTAEISSVIYKAAYNSLRKTGHQIIDDGKLYDKNQNLIQQLSEEDKSKIIKTIDDAGEKTGLSIKYGKYADYSKVLDDALENTDNFLTGLTKLYNNPDDAQKLYIYFSTNYSSLKVKQWGIDGLVDAREELLKFITKFNNKDALIADNFRLIDSWVMMKNFTNLRNDEEVIKNLGIILKNKYYKSVEEVENAINSSTNVGELIENLSLAKDADAFAEALKDVKVIDFKVTESALLTPSLNPKISPSNSTYNEIVNKLETAKSNRIKASEVQTKNDLSEEIGLLSADKYMMEHGYVPLDHELSSTSKQGQFDRIYWNGNAEKPEVFVIECKGGAGELGSRKLKSGTNLGSRAQQGSPQYRDDIIENMKAKATDPEILNTIENIENAINKKSLNYLLIRQEIKSDGFLGNLIIKEFPK